MPRKLENLLWWERGIIYQVYPRSFFDSNSDGVGDLEGVRQKLDYLRWLGVTAVWLSPINPSPMADFGYDVSNYEDVDPIFGTLADFDALLSDAHRLGLKIILDFVPNHTSDRHPWFIESRSSRTSSKRNWYIWRDPAPGGDPPNNWLSTFGGIGWTFDEGTGQYYYHAFLKEQPDLNWRNPEVEQAMHCAMRFWLDRGVDGFRVDVIWHLIKDEEFRDNPPNEKYHERMMPSRRLSSSFSTDRPEVHDVIARMRKVLDEYDERMMVGEIYLPVERVVAYYGTGGRGAHLPFNFQLVEIPWQAEIIAAAIRRYESLLPKFGWPNWVLGNHDRARIATRAGGPNQARVSAMLLLTLRGTPTLYYGDEIGMENVEIPPEQVQDPLEKNVPGAGLGRDPVRTPMQWNSSPYAGFSLSRPWLPLAPDYQQRNVEKEAGDEKSMLSLTRRLIALRQSEPALIAGGYGVVGAEEGVLFFNREHDGSRFAVLLNLTGRGKQVSLPDFDGGRIELSTDLMSEGERVTAEIRLEPDQGLIVRVG